MVWRVIPGQGSPWRVAGALALAWAVGAWSAASVAEEPVGDGRPAVEASAPPAEGEADCADPAARPGYLTLNTVPWTSVQVDGQPMGSTPLFRQRLAPGTHRLLLVNRAAGVETTEDVEIESGRTRKLSLVLLTGETMSAALPEAPPPSPEDAADCGEDISNPGFLSIQSTPWARVVLDGRPVGSTPVFRLAVAPGLHVLRLVNDQAPQPLNMMLRVEVAAGETVKVVVAR
jgi:hypothetical protein